MISASQPECKRWRCRLGSPAVPAWVLVVGLFPYLMVLHYLSASATSTATAMFFGSAMLWTSAVVMPRLAGLRAVKMDWWFLLFVLILLAWAMRQWGTNASIYIYYKYLPAFVILPYLVGRTFDQLDIEIFLQIVVFAAVALLPLLAVKLLALPKGTIRPWLFGYVHGAQLSGLALSLGSVVLVGWLSMQLDGFSNGRLARIAGVLLLFACAFMLTLTSARGFMLAMVITSFVLILLGSGGRRWRSIIGLAVAVPLAVGLLLSNGMIWYLDYGMQGAVLVAEHGIARGEVPISANGVTETSIVVEVKSEAEVPIPANGVAETCAALFGDATHAGNSVAARAQLWFDSYSIIKLAPLFGVGPGHFKDFSCAPYPHSTVWQALAELGVVGALPLLTLMGMAVLSLSRERGFGKPGRGTSYISSLLGILLLICITDQIYGNYFQAGLFFLACGITGALVQRRLQLRGVHERA